MAGRITGAQGRFFRFFEKLCLKVLDKKNIMAYNEGMLSKKQARKLKAQ